jgi:AraC family transcriptional regulator
MARAPSERRAVRDLPPVFPDRPGERVCERAWSNVSGTRLTRVVEEVTAPAFTDHVILVNVGRPYRMEERLDGRVYRTSGVSGDVAIIPAGTPSEFRSREREPQEVDSFAMRLDPAFVGDAARGADVGPDGIELVGIMGGRDPEIERIGASLLSEMESGGLLGDLYADSLATMLAVSLLRRHSSLGRGAARKTVRAPSGGLPRAALRRVTDYVEENLSGDLTLAELSGVAHMSPFHFSRVFKLSTGLSPHRYVVRRRIERAKRLLADSELPLHEVARAAGFADQSHLARHFRLRLGTTPRSFRLASG